MAQIEQERISALDSLVTQSADGVNELIESTAEAAKWAMAVDYIVPDSDTANQEDLVDQGTKRIPVSRIGLLTDSRTVPQSMLPHQMDEILNGRMVHDTSTGKWTFTTTVDGVQVVYVCPGPPAEGERRPVISTIYRDVSDEDQDGNPIYTQYRYVPDDNADVGTASETGSFVPIPSDLVMINGAGTVVSDNDGSYTRAVDIVIGAPAAETNTHNSLLISNGKLSHATSGVTAGTYPTPPQSSQLTFGGTFAVDAFTVNSTGHVTAVTPYSLTVPDTAASLSTEGLVKIGSTDDIQNIGQQKSAGTTTPSPYVKVAAADHVHAASHLILENINDSTHFQNGRLEYTGAGSDIEYSFKNILKATLPTTGPTAAGQLLVSEGTSASNMQAVWKNPDNVFTPEYAFVKVASGCTCGTSPVIVPFDTSTETHGGSMTVAQTEFGGLKAGKAYVVCFNFGFSHSSATTFIEDAAVMVQTGADSQWTSVAEYRYYLDGSITGVPNYINGCIIFSVSNGHTLARLRLNTGRSSWNITTDSSVQIAEVK